MSTENTQHTTTSQTPESILSVPYAYAYSNEPTPRPLYDADDMRDYAQASHASLVARVAELEGLLHQVVLGNVGGHFDEIRAALGGDK